MACLVTLSLRLFSCYIIFLVTNYLRIVDTNIYRSFWRCGAWFSALCSWDGKIRLFCRKLLVSSLGELVFCYCVKIRKTCSKVGFGRKVREIRRYISNESSTIIHFSKHI
ncbi:uncharacterized protein K444DRAFT_53142 [Hyaloscypha bicolor E]|uniref:Uncharacterized protein n=1 Tax=Hyaloscypha bicolor E TaxID=1095630 RepID=A0A2J6T311_9HELO|nr:uncharacterized protein K444DRAFT_53142 [Hyaloscypha bicolor E]PMD57387.1 hypothetical protein K444DRAFT_53142 [Hyaloscypha bicolor E]